jgi:S-adenosylmethionine:tRNA-ribosyltransferase-isomerase (queuine synthetase)
MKNLEKLTELGETQSKYINRGNPEDADRYQTIYAKEEELLQPTAGLHSKHLLKD